MFGYRRGQGATEYLVLLAVVLIVALVAMALLNFFPDLSTYAKISQSDSYWRGVSRPFAITESAQSSSSANLIMVVENKDAEQRILTTIQVSGTGVATNYTVTGNNRYFSAGEKRTFTIPLSTNCTAGSVYEYKISFNYTNADGTISKVQIGDKPLMGKCS